MSGSSLRRAAAFVLLCAPLAAAPESRPLWKNQGVKGFFRCELPADWRAKETPAPDRGALYIKGGLSIRVVRHGGKDSPFRTPEAYLKVLPVAPEDIRRSTVSAAGRPRELLALEYRLNFGGDDHPSRSERIHEEIVLLRDKDGFWVLSLRANAFLPAQKRGADVWKRFLKSFRPG